MLSGHRCNCHRLHALLKPSFKRQGSASASSERDDFLLSLSRHFPVSAGSRPPAPARPVSAPGPAWLTPGCRLPPAGLRTGLRRGCPGYQTTKTAFSSFQQIPCCPPLRGISKETWSPGTGAFLKGWLPPLPRPPTTLRTPPQLIYDPQVGFNIFPRLNCFGG